MAASGKAARLRLSVFRLLGYAGTRVRDLRSQASSLATLRSGDPALQSPLRRAEKRAPLRYEARASLPWKRVAGKPGGVQRRDRRERRARWRWGKGDSKRHGTPCAVDFGPAVAGGYGGQALDLGLYFSRPGGLQRRTWRNRKNESSVVSPEFLVRIKYCVPGTPMSPELLTTIRTGTGFLTAVLRPLHRVLGHSLSSENGQTQSSAAAASAADRCGLIRSTCNVTLQFRFARPGQNVNCPRWFSASFFP